MTVGINISGYHGQKDTFVSEFMLCNYLNFPDINVPFENPVSWDYKQSVLLILVSVLVRDTGIKNY